MEKGKSVQLYVAVKHAGNIAKKVKESPLLLANTPGTLGELIEESVKYCIGLYKSRSDSARAVLPLTDEQFEGMREIGKFAFGVHYNENNVDEEKAVKAALDALNDGLVRVFKGNTELTGADTAVKISDGDVFTFVRLTMLSGRMW